MRDEQERMDREISPQDYRDLADSAAAAEAFQRGELELTPDQPAEMPPPPENEPLVVRSLRLPLNLELRVKAVAAAEGIPPTVLMREWIADGVEAAEGGRARRDPVAWKELKSRSNAYTRWPAVSISHTSRSSTSPQLNRSCS
jgi:chromosomal replication initiator protein